MKLTEGELVQWKVGDAHHTGRKVSGVEGPVILSDYAIEHLYPWFLVKHSYTGELHAVLGEKLSPYPSEPIPEPSK